MPDLDFDIELDFGVAEKPPKDFTKGLRKAGRVFGEVVSATPTTPVEIGILHTFGSEGLRRLKLFKRTLSPETRRTVETTQFLLMPQTRAFTIANLAVTSPLFRRVTRTPEFQGLAKTGYKGLIIASPLPDNLKKPLLEGVDKLTPEAITRLNQIGGHVAIISSLRFLGPKAIARIAKLPASKRIEFAFTDPEVLASRALEEKGLSRQILRFAPSAKREAFLTALRKKVAPTAFAPKGLLEFRPVAGFVRIPDIPQSLIKKFKLSTQQVTRLQVGDFAGFAPAIVRAVRGLPTKAPEVVFRAQIPTGEGAGAIRGKAVLGSGIYVATDERMAELYKTYVDGGRVFKFQLKSGLKLLDWNSKEFVDIKKKYGLEKDETSPSKEISDKITEDVKALGYDGIRSDDRVTGMVIFDKKNLLPTKAPLLKPPKVELLKKPVRPATEAQIKEAHIIAKHKALITPEGKTKPQYRRLAEGMTGEKSMKKMTQEQAVDFTNALTKISEPYYRGVRLVPPSIPKVKALVPKEFFKRKFKMPTPLKHLTSQQYYAEQLGVKELVAPLELAKQRFDLEVRAMNAAVNQQEININRIGKTTLMERAQARIRNVPTMAVAEMRDLLDRYEEAPDFLPQEKKEIFNWFRNLNRTMLKGENAVRKSLELELIPYRKAYVRHVADAMAQELLQGKYPFPEGLKYWADRLVGKKVFNPMAMRRQLADDLENYFTKDLIYATKSMMWTGLKEIHLSQPLKAFSEQLGAISRDMPIYKDLSMEELAEIRKMSIIPASTKRWLIEYVNQVIKGQQPELDEVLNRLVTDSGLGGLIDKALKPFGRTVGRKPLTNVFRGLGKSVIRGVMGWRPKQLIRNKFQLFQNLALYGIKANLKGFFPVSVDRNMERLISKSLFFKGYTGIEETPKDFQMLLDRLWLSPYQWTAVTNAGQAMKVSYWDTLDLVVKPKYKGFGWADPSRTYKEPKGFLYPSEETKLLKEMEFGAAATQYSYIPMGMPQIFRYKALIPITRLQSWWMRYFTQFTRESINRLFKGETTYGAKLPWSRRLGYLRYLIIGGSIFSALGYKRSFLLGVLPTYLSPATQVALGLYIYTTSDKEWEKKMALKRMQNSWKAFIPGSLAWKDFMRVWKGEKPLKSLFLYMPYEKKFERDFDLELDMGVDIGEIDIEL